MDHKLKIQEQKQKIAAHFSHSEVLLDYLIETLDSFLHRYLETSVDKVLHTTELGHKQWGARSHEIESMEILKIKNPAIRPHLIAAAKTLAAKGGLVVEYTLGIEPKELGADEGELVIFSKVDWSKTPLTMDKSSEEKVIGFKYHSLSEFRKNLALKLEEASEIFL